MPPALKLTGKKFGRLTVVEKSKKRNKINKSVQWTCKCNCGNTKDIIGVSLVNGLTLSCGCLHKEISKQTSTKHGLVKEKKFYYRFHGIVQRCENKKASGYEGYGGRGIKCEWDDIIEFKKDMYESYKKHCKDFGESNTSIDRIDNDGDYCKENCRWVTNEEQANNKRNSHLVTYKGKTQTLAQWARELNIKYKTLLARINDHKWPVKKAFETPIRNY